MSITIASEKPISYSLLQQFSQKAALYSTLGFAFFIPISPALMNVSLLFALIFILLSGQLQQHWKTAWNNPVSKGGILLFLLFALSTAWSISGWDESLNTLKKYNELWYIALLLPLFSTEEHRRLGANTFLLSMGLILCIVYSIYFGLMPEIEIPISEKSTTYITIDGGFRTHIITNILMSFATFVFAQRMFFSLGQKRFLYGLLFLFSGYYAIFISTGTTGQILTIGLLGLLIIQHYRWKGLVIAPLMVVAILGYGLSNPNTSINHGVTKIVYGIDQYNQGNTNVGTAKRLEFYRNSVRLIEEAPWIGSGVGSFEQRYNKIPEQYILSNRTSNPHNEYLVTAVQLGLVGLTALLILLAVEGRCSFHITNRESRFITQGLVALIYVGCLGNSLILDSGEGHFWAFFSALLFSALPDREAC